MFLFVLTDYGMASTLYIDFQGFYNNEDQIFIKEFASFDAKTFEIRTALFQAPCEWSRLSTKTAQTNDWCSRNIIRLGWEAGNVAYEKINEVVKDICRNYPVLISKGLEKVNVFQDILERGVLNLEDIDCPRLDDLALSKFASCIYHKGDQFASCALQNAIHMAEWHSTVLPPYTPLFMKDK